MAKVKLLFGAAAVRDMLSLPSTVSVERLIQSGVLEISAYTARGAPLFAVDSIRRAADRVLFVREDQPAP